MQQELTRLARKAIDELNLPCEVVAVVAHGQDAWTIEFTTGYGALTDTFHDETGQKYSNERIVDTIKHHLNAQEK